MAEDSGVLSQVFELAKQFGTPFARRFAYGADNATELELAEERAAYNRLNGSGANDERGFLRLPKTEGQQAAQNPGPIPFGLTPQTLLLAAVAIVVAVFLVRKL